MPSPYPASKYIISKRLDPAFAIFIGVSAGLVRIRNEESLKRSGLPSASMVISDEQKARIDARRAAALQSRPAPKVYESGLFGKGMGADTEGYADYENGGVLGGSWGAEREGERVEVGYREIVEMGWARAKWRLDYWWNDRGRDLVRKDGRMV